MKKTASLLVAVLLLTLCIPGTAFAANETGGTTTVTYTYEKTYVDEYIINIPSQYVITDGSYMEISSSKMDISDSKYIYVSLDPNKNALAENIMNLTGQNGNAIRCQIFVDNSLDPSGTLSRLDNCSYRVALFDNHSTAPYQFGRVYIVPEIDSGTPEGTYSGTLTFDIVLVDRG